MVKRIWTKVNNEEEHRKLIEVWGDEVDSIFFHQEKHHEIYPYWFSNDQSRQPDNGYIERHYSNNIVSFEEIVSQNTIENMSMVVKSFEEFCKLPNGTKLRVRINNSLLFTAYKYSLLDCRYDHYLLYDNPNHDGGHPYAIKKVEKLIGNTFKYAYAVNENNFRYLECTIIENKTEVEILLW